MNDILKNIFLFFLLVFAQVIVFNNILFWGYLNPLPYILFIIVYPLKKDRGFFLIISFLLGLCIDFFMDSGGINAAVTLFIAYIRLPLLKSLLRKTDIDFTLFNVGKLPFTKLMSYIAILTFSHHFLIYYLEYFKLSSLGTVFLRAFSTGIFTIILLIFSLILMNKSK